MIAPSARVFSDKDLYQPGETVRIGLRLVNPHEIPFPSTRLMVDIVWPSGDWITLFDSGELTIPPMFSKTLQGAVTIPDSVFVPDGEYGFRAKLRCGGYVGSRTAWFEIIRTASESEKDLIEMYELD